MKNVVFLFVVLFTLTFLPLGSMADETVYKIPNHMDKQEANGALIIEIDDTEDTDLTPLQRKIVKRDAIRSNAPTGAVDSGSAIGQ